MIAEHLRCKGNPTKILPPRVLPGYWLYAGLAMALCFGVFNARAALKSGSPPDWVKERTSSEYPSSKYLIGIGQAKKTGEEAADIQAAENSARANLASQIKVQVQSNLTTRIQEQQEQEKGKGSKRSKITTTQEAVSQIMSSVDLELEGIKIAELYYSKKEKQYYALAVLARRGPAADNLHNCISEARRTAGEFYSQGNSALNQRDVARAMASFKRARQELMNIEGKDAMLAVISGRAASLDPQALTIGKCELAMDKAMEAIRFVVQIYAQSPFSPSSSLVQSQVIQGLRQKGYNVMDNAAAFQGYDYNTLRNASPAQLRNLPGLAGNYLVLGNAAAHESSQTTIGTTRVHFYLTSAELKIVNLDTGKMLVTQAFDWGAQTKAGMQIPEKAASGSLTKAGDLLAEFVSNRIEEIFKTME